MFLYKECPDGCTCNKERMDCTSAHLTSLPTVHSTVLHLVLDNNTLTSLGDICKQAPNLR